MKTTIAIEGNRFYINGKPTYEGRLWQGLPIEGLLFNSRMIQGIFDDECEETRKLWAYPDTGEWDPERNTRELCAALPEYRRHGLLGITVGMQGGGSIYTPHIYDAYINSAFTPEGELKSAYLQRLHQLLHAADEVGMIVIVNYFYVKQARRLSDRAVIKATEAMTGWLLESGFQNILVDVANESNPFWKREIFEPANIHRLIEIVQGITRRGRRLLVGASTGGKDQISIGRWREIEDFAMPHGNGCTPEQLRRKLQRLKNSDEHRRKPRPILINEDSVFIENMDAAIAEYASWGFYCQGYGSDYRDRMNWKIQPREKTYDELSGFQTVPVNWSINTPIKKRFFDHLLEVTGGR